MNGCSDVVSELNWERHPHFEMIPGIGKRQRRNYRFLALVAGFWLLTADC
jgi:hypothetical protein